MIGAGISQGVRPDNDRRRYIVSHWLEAYLAWSLYMA